MKLRDLVKELISEDMDSEVYAKYIDDEGNEKFFSFDGLAFECKSYFYNGLAHPTIILSDA